jgi:tRNA A37 threonylcarbamoyladenosine synthetase subunit TsaC/SUA5/YrdC
VDRRDNRKIIWQKHAWKMETLIAFYAKGLVIGNRMYIKLIMPNMTMDGRGYGTKNVTLKSFLSSSCIMMKFIPIYKEVLMIVKNALVYLVQTDTTAGFLSKDAKLLNAIKQRPLNKPCILCAAAFRDILPRVPPIHKKLARGAKNTTFILSNGQCFRVVKDDVHRKFLAKMGAMYSTSANLTNQSFDIDFAKSRADVIVEDNRGLYESKPSTMIKLGRKTLKKIR